MPTPEATTLSTEIMFEGGVIRDHSQEQVIPPQFRCFELSAETDEMHWSDIQEKMVRSFRHIMRWSSGNWTDPANKAFQEDIVAEAEKYRRMRIIHFGDSPEKPTLCHLHAYDARWSASD